MLLMEVLELILNVGAIGFIFIATERLFVQISLFLVLNLVPLFLRLAGSIVISGKSD
jgi:hypothetical protein